MEMASGTGDILSYMPTIRFQGLGAIALSQPRHKGHFPFGARAVPRHRGFGVTAIIPPLYRGMGVLDYYGLLAQANLQNCDPHDEACVADNVAKQAAVEDYWAAHMSTGVPDNTQLTFAPLTSGQVAAFASPGSATIGNVVPTGIMQVGTWQSAPETPVITSLPSPAVPGAPAAPAPKATAPASTVTPQGQTIINSSGANQPRNIGTSDTGFSFLGMLRGCSLPDDCWFGFPKWLVIAVGVGAGVFAFGGSRGR